MFLGAPFTNTSIKLFQTDFGENATKILDDSLPKCSISWKNIYVYFQIFQSLKYFYHLVNYGQQR